MSDEPELVMPLPADAKPLFPHLLAGVRAGLVIQPGDRVLLASIEPFHQDFPGMQAELRERFPGVEFTIVAGVTDLAVQRAPTQRAPAEPARPPCAQCGQPSALHALTRTGERLGVGIDHDYVAPA